MKGILPILCIVGLFNISAHCYLYQRPLVLRKWHPEHQQYHYWIGFSDFHDKTHKDNVPQRKIIEDNLPLLDPGQVLVLVEDLSSPNDSGCTGCGSYYINSRTGILAGLGSYCKEKNIPCMNVEYRYCRVVALGPVINNINADPALFPSTKKISVTNLLQEIESTYNELLLSNPLPQFKTVFLDKARGVIRTMEKMNLMRNHHKTISEYVVGHSTPITRLEMVKTMLTFDGILIGFKLVDATLKASHKGKILAFAGGTHIAEAYELLQTIDSWEPVNPGDHPDLKPALGRSINTPLNKGLNGKPPSLSLDLLEHYLKN